MRLPSRLKAVTERFIDWCFDTPLGNFVGFVLLPIVVLGVIVASVIVGHNVTEDWQ